MDCIIEKCKNQSYTFSPYREVLISKKRNKYPRCISIPTVRDRLVLGVLNEYLQNVFEEAINHETPSLLIQKVKLYLSLNKNKEIRFFKSDFYQFYDNIRHPILIFKAIWDTIRKNTLYEKRVYFETHSKNKINLWQIIK